MPTIPNLPSSGSSKLPLSYLSNLLIMENDPNTGETRTERVTVKQVTELVTGTSLTYRATLTQRNSEAPVETVLYSTLGALQWSRVSSGLYIGVLMGAFPENRTFISFNPAKLPDNHANIIRLAWRGDENSIVIETRLAGNRLDGQLFENSLEVMVF